MFEQQCVAQINTYPLDVGHIEHSLRHQIRVWEPMVEQIVVVIDTHQSHSGRYRGTLFHDNLGRLRRLVTDARKGHPKLKVVEVDYSAAMRTKIAQWFFGVDDIPIKAWDGGPFYAYFFGLFHAAARYVMHFDGDMLFGGGSVTWAEEAIRYMQSRPDVLITSPFPGPPRHDGAIFGHPARSASGPIEGIGHLAYRHSHVSTRAFMIDLERFKRKLKIFAVARPSLWQRMKAGLLGNPKDVCEAEVVMSNALRESNCCRVDMVGQAPGLWSLHPPFRSDTFYARLPDVIRDIESGCVPSSQRGHYDVHDSMIDWTSARAANRWYWRYWQMLRQRFAS